MCEVEIEEVRGLPGSLPKDEKVLWQGQPTWQALARRCFRVRLVAVYFGIFAVLWSGLALAEGAGVGAAALAGLKLVPIAALGIALLCGLAWLTARTTIYTVTNKRVAIRFGIALPMTINLPFVRIGSADMVRYGDDSGDIVLDLTGSDRLAYLHLWPNVRPWRFAKAQPMLRGLPQVREAGRVLAEAMATAIAERQADERAEAAQAAVREAAENAKRQAGVSKINERPAAAREGLVPAMPVAAAE
jgi:hypothetical protein